MVLLTLDSSVCILRLIQRKMEFHARNRWKYVVYQASYRTQNVSTLYVACGYINLR